MLEVIEKLLVLLIDVVDGFFAEHMDLRTEQLFGTIELLELREQVDETSEPFVKRIIMKMTGRLGQASAPIDVGPVLRDQLFNRVRSVILTSATLSVGRGSSSFDFFRSRIGLTQSHSARMEGAATLSVPLTVDVGMADNWRDAK